MPLSQANVVSLKGRLQGLHAYLGKPKKILVEKVFEMAQSVKQIRLDHLGGPKPLLEMLWECGKNVGI